MNLAVDNRSEVDGVYALCLARSNQVSIENFSDEELNVIINCIPPLFYML